MYVSLNEIIGTIIMEYNCHTYWKIVYSKGNQKGLAVAEMDDTDELDYDIASRQTFLCEDTAYAYMVELADNAGLSYKRKKNSFLD